MSLLNILDLAGAVLTTRGTPFHVFFTTPDLNPFDDFPSSKSPDLQTALNAAIDGVLLNGQVRKEPRSAPGDPNVEKEFPIPFTIADVTDGVLAHGVPVAHYNGDEVDFIASVAKVPVMYAAFQLRNMVQRFADELGFTKKTDLFAKLNVLDPIILGNPNVPMLRAAKDIEGNDIRNTITIPMRLPQYDKVFDVTEIAGKLKVDFKGALAAAPLIDDPTDRHRPPRKIADPNSDYGHALFEMIVTSDDVLAGTCIHGIGYGFLNGALDAGGYFERPTPADPKTFRGIWVGGDFASQEMRGVMTKNDGGGKLAGTTRRLAQMLAAIRYDIFKGVDFKAVDHDLEMRKLLAAAVTDAGALEPWESDASAGADAIKSRHFIMNKVGVDSLGRGGRPAPSVFSEVCLLKSKSAKSYVVAYQNRETTRPDAHGVRFAKLYTRGHVAKIIRDTVQKYEGVADDPFPP